MVAAFFDVDGTLTETNVLMPLIWLQRETLPRHRYWLWLCKLICHLPIYLVADQIDRSIFVTLFFRQYAGIPSEKARQWFWENFENSLKPRVYNDALREIQWHCERNHQIVLVTGGADFTVAPLARWLSADLLAAKLEEVDGKFTGRLVGKPLIGVGKADAIKTYAGEKGIDLQSSYAYGDSVSDAPMLECVGNPVAVNPDRKLRRLAMERGWRIVQWR
ncbi:HAD-IB family hydrolase [Fervidibacter sacchari]|uniref:HAD superfamily hydrolase (TIGR01490 family) n=1 Tax=Candidatus Fervidibacter sacchari TaxID=1448929 RepID=A0ABT2ESV7_9BACT|nr:HAD-IB family hydrolase [Candidatus Fervidibacter sacchari]MCS3921053.1 HAD superfamily hydrolase (TIGR01490 family) [Candidatus Fervidibacter sacchari]WKU16589.1 HAD-IB family hydrolase [Candidatus Fervidibacter sacchari]